MSLAQAAVTKCVMDISERLLCAGAMTGLVVTTQVLAAPASLDTQFGQGVGKVFTATSGAIAARASALSLQLNGKIALIGSCDNGESFNANFAFCAARYNSDGALDTSFGGGGPLITRLTASGSNTASAAAFQTDGKLVVAGSCSRSNGIGQDFCMLRHNVDGSLDPTFGVNGKVIAPITAQTDQVHALAIQSDEKIVTAGSCGGLSTPDFCVARFNKDGSLDETFGTDGKVLTSFSVNGAEVASALAIQSDGKLVLAGRCANAGSFSYHFCAARLQLNGALDPTFGSAGKLVLLLGGPNDTDLRSLALQPDGKMVLTGQCGDVGAPICVVRLNADGSIDANFGVGGKAVSIMTNAGSSNATASGVSIQSDGRILVAGTCGDYGFYDFCAMRLNPDGVHDLSFGNAGKVFTPVSVNSSDVSSAIALQPDGRILVGGYCGNGSGNDFCLVRYEGGPSGYRQCSMDIDGDGAVLATTDSLIHARISIGMRGDSVVAGISFALNARRTSWASIRTHLVTQCGMSLVQ